MREAAIRAPKTDISLEVATNIATDAVFVCAERQVQALAKDNDLWILGVTRRDAATATLETGHYEDDNVTGFRIRLHHRPAAGKIDIELKGAGAYFTDLGVDAAIADFRRDLERCLDQEKNRPRGLRPGTNSTARSGERPSDRAGRPPAGTSSGIHCASSIAFMMWIVPGHQSYDDAARRAGAATAGVAATPAVGPEPAQDAVQACRHGSADTAPARIVLRLPGRVRAVPGAARYNCVFNPYS